MRLSLIQDLGMHNAAVKSGSDVDSLPEVDKGLWDHPDMDPNTCETASLFFPIGPWASVAGENGVEQTQLLKYAGSLIRQDFLVFISIIV